MRTWETLLCPSPQARCKAVCPEPSFSSIFTEGCSRRAFTISSFPRSAAKCSGVLPLIPLMDGSAPRCKRTFTVERPLNLCDKCHKSESIVRSIIIHICNLQV